MITIFDTFQFERAIKKKKAIAMNKKGRLYTGEEMKAIFWAEKVAEYRNKAENIESEIILIERSERERVV